MCRNERRAYETHVIYGSRRVKPTLENIGPLIIHELGHTLMYSAGKCTYANHMDTNLMKTYVKLRNIANNPKYTPDSAWHRRPAEIFAEDFRYLFGDVTHLTEPFSTFPNGEPPSNEIKEFMKGVVLSMLNIDQEKIDEIKNMIENEDITEDNQGKVTISDWETDFEEARHMGITDGSNPTGYATRKETAVMVRRAMRITIKEVLTILEKIQAEV